MHESGGNPGVTSTNPEKHTRAITRRDFIKGTVLTAAQLSLGADILEASAAEAEHRPTPSDVPPPATSKVVLVRDPDVMDASLGVNQRKVDEMLEDALLTLSGEKDAESAWSKYFEPSDVVGVKMNVMMTATHSEVVRAIVKGLRSIGVEDKNIIAWDRDEAGVGYNGINRRNHHYGYSRSKISKIITDHCTALINVPGLKSHWLSGIAVALKNWVGAITGINVSDLFVTFAIHKDSCAEVGSINAIPVIRNKSRLIIVDALRPLFHGGPQVNPRYLWPYKGLLVSTDPVAMDAVCLKLIQAKRDEFAGRPWPVSPPAKHIVVADKKYRIGNSDLEKITVIKRGWLEDALI